MRLSDLFDELLATLGVEELDELRVEIEGMENNSEMGIDGGISQGYIKDVGDERDLEPDTETEPCSQ
jgi:hypothetical protein